VRKKQTLKNLSEKEKENKVETWVFGHHAVKSLLDSTPERVLALHYVIDKNEDKRHSLVYQAEAFGISCSGVSKSQLENWLGPVTHQGIAVKVRVQKARDENDLLDILKANKKPAFLLILDGVQDPHNLGACLRSAEAAGVDAVLIPEHKAVGLTPVVRKVASGATEWLPLIQVGNLARVMRELKDLGIWFVGTDSVAKKNLYELDLRMPLAWVMGSEGSGLRRLTKELCDFEVSIPLQGKVESLNVSVASAVCLFETLRQRL